MKKNYKIISIFFIVSSLILTFSSCSIANPNIAEPEKVGTLIEAIQPGEKIKLAVKIANVAADNGDKIVVHFHFAPADSLGYFFTDDIVSTHDIFITSSGK